MSSSTMSETIVLSGENLDFDKALKVIYDQTPVVISDEARERVRQARAVVEQQLADGRPIYGINTGFGKLSDVQISSAHLDELQENLVLSHACGVGDPIPPEAVRAILLFKINTLIKGFSGVREEVVDALLALLNRNVLPVIPEKGSVGASGDLAPLAHLALVLIGRGRATIDGKTVSGEEAMKRTGVQPLRLKAKEGLALLNGTHFMLGLGAINWAKARQLERNADLIGGLTTEAVLGTPVAFDERIQRARGYSGQIEAARRLRRVLENSPIRESHLTCSRVQDPYCIRCMPQVHGAVIDHLNHLKTMLTTEMNAATDNPLIFIEQGDILSGGNFHGHPIATTLDFLAILAAQLSNISERRIALMMDSNLSDLPAFLIAQSGLNSGFMITQVTAASLVSENKVLAHPASVDSIPTSANKEDYVSMGAQAAVKTHKVLNNLATVLGIELICACQSLDLRKPLKPGPVGQRVLEFVRKRIAYMQKDRFLADDIQTARNLLWEDRIYPLVRDLIE
ncbi:MAG: histidine ammonia-lyase [candidate division KSB1 bacterium]|nr:histidine ammonia-lyase [candidate division KSB1 bacterium]